VVILEVSNTMFPSHLSGIKKVNTNDCINNFFVRIEIKSQVKSSNKILKEIKTQESEKKYAVFFTRLNNFTVRKTFLTGMGHTHSTPFQNNLSNDFFQYCCNGNVNGVRELLPILTYDDVNYIDPTSGQTSLHVACSNTHYEIVRLLLEHNVCNRIIRNGNNKTAYEVAASPEIRSLFNFNQHPKIEQLLICLLIFLLVMVLNIGYYTIQIHPNMSNSN
jgi:hypothetical protein